MAPEASVPRSLSMGKCAEVGGGAPSCPRCGTELQALEWDEPSLLPDGATAHFVLLFCECGYCESGRVTP